MAAWYDSGMIEIMNGATDYSADTIRVLLTKVGYVFNAVHDFVDDITNEVSGGSYARQDLATKTETGAAGRAFFDAADSTFTAVAAGQDDINAAIIFQFVTSDALSATLWHCDFTSINGNGSDIQVQWNASGICEIT